MTIHTKLVCFFLTLIQLLTLITVGKGSEHNMIINYKSENQIFEGFGTSSCWWSQTIDNDSLAKIIAKMLYSKKDGLGLSVYRYNIGGGENDNPNTRIPSADRRTESFYVYDESSKQYKYDFSRDKNARRMLDYAIDAGASEVILFCNSPHFSMTESGQASGGLKDYQSNLPKHNYAKFVDYVLTIADWFVAQGYPVVAISPINEPQWCWGGEQVSQEGCHYTADEAVELLELFATVMQRRNTPYGLRCPESGEMSFKQYDYITKFNASKILTDYCEYFSGHSYWMDKKTDEKSNIAKFIKMHNSDIKYEMSEWCELPQTIDPSTIDSGLFMADVVIDDLVQMNAVSWQCWTAVNGDGLLYKDGNSVGTFYRYYTFKQFTSFIEPGMTRVNVTDSKFKSSGLKAVAFTDGTKTIMVVLNSTETAEKINATADGINVEVYTTDATRNCEKTYSGTDFNNMDIPAKSVSTFVFSN